MAAEEVPAAGAVLTANGDTAGVGTLTIADTTPFYTGAKAWLSATGLNQRVMIVKITSATVMSVRFLVNDAVDQTKQMYGNVSSCAAYTLVGNARIDQELQVVRVIQSQISKRAFAN